MDAALLDTDILSEFIKRQNAPILTHASAYLQQYGRFTFSAFSRFEIRRGFHQKQASRQLARFEIFCGHSAVLPVTDAIFDRAALLWADARKRGHASGDADLLIAATAIEHGLVLATGNVRHFVWVPGLQMEDWKNP